MRYITQHLRLQFASITLLSTLWQSRAFLTMTSLPKPGSPLPRLDAMEEPVANISSYCQSLFVNVLCENSSFAYNVKRGPCINCTIHMFYKRFCKNGTESQRFSKSSEQSSVTESLNKVYCEDHNYNFKKNATEYLDKYPHFKLHCQDQVNAFCPSFQSKELSRKEKEKLFVYTRDKFVRELKQDVAMLRKDKKDRHRGRKLPMREKSYEDRLKQFILPSLGTRGPKKELTQSPKHLEEVHKRTFLRRAFTSKP